MTDINAKVAGVTPGLQPSNPAYNTYVGSRYVPVFGNKPTYEWDNTKAYEPLTIVLHEGNSYTSTTFVPVGADIEDGQYWAKTGNYNAQVESYRQEVLNYTAKIKEINTGLTKKNRQVIILGDSWANGYPEQDKTTGWLNFLIAQPWFTITNYTAAKSGCGYSSASNNWLNLLKTVSVPDKNLISEIYVCGGTNDLNASASPIISGLTALSSYVKTTYPNATLYNVFISTLTNQSARAAYMECCQNAHVSVINFTNFCNFMGSEIWTDSNHPTNTFHSYLAGNIGELIQNKKPTVNWSYSSNAVTPAAGITFDTSANIGWSVLENSKNINFNLFHPKGSFVQKTYYTIARLSKSIMPINWQSTAIDMYVSGYVQTASGQIPANIFFRYNNSTNDTLVIEMSWTPLTSTSEIATVMVTPSFSVRDSAFIL